MWKSTQQGPLVMLVKQLALLAPMVCDLLIAVGGDGTVSEVVNGLYLQRSKAKQRFSENTNPWLYPFWGLLMILLRPCAFPMTCAKAVKGNYQRALCPN